MKKIIYILSFSLILSSCSGFLDRNPIAQTGSEDFIKDETSLKLFTNGFLEKYTPSIESCAYGDGYSDIVATNKSTSFLTDPWNAEVQSGWTKGTWNKLYRINYFLDHINEAAANVDEAMLAHYEGTARFWRADFYMGMIKTYGAAPYYDKVIPIDDLEKLFAKRDDRETVMQKVLEDLNFACEHISNDTEWLNNGQINKYIALGMKSRICLFEGTYRKYHKVDPATGLEWKNPNSAEKFLREAVDAAKQLIDMNAYHLVNNPANVKTQYRSLFTKEELNYTEVIWGRECNTAMTTFNQLTWKFTSATYGSRWSLNDDFVRMYLDLDGSRHSAKNESFFQEMENRDCRLAQSVVAPGYQKIVGGNVTEVGPNFGVTLTGFQIIKFNLDNDIYESSKNGYNSLPIMRYAEILLNYAEAKAELGEFTQEDWDLTIRPLRERSGVNGTRPQDADPYLVQYYGVEDNDILEIRRERSIELLMEGFRYDDLMRWHCGNLLNRTWYGIYVPQLNSVMDVNEDGINDVCIVSSDEHKGDEPGVVYLSLSDAYKLENGDKGRLIYDVSRIFDERRYLHPVPASALRINPDLGQNIAWR